MRRHRFRSGVPPLSDLGICRRLAVNDSPKLNDDGTVRTHINAATMSGIFTVKDWPSPLPTLDFSGKNRQRRQRKKVRECPPVGYRRQLALGGAAEMPGLFVIDPPPA